MVGYAKLGQRCTSLDADLHDCLPLNSLAWGQGKDVVVGEIRAKRHVGQSFFDRHLASATSRLLRSRGYLEQSSACVSRGNVTVASRRDVDYISQSIYIIQDLK